MFTGIVEELGEVVEVADLGDAARLVVRGPVTVPGSAPGDSIAVGGVCLTVESLDGDAFVADVMKETLARSSLGALVPGSRVNLERALRADARLGGHVVQGHVDGTGTVVGRTPSEHWELVEVRVPAQLARYVVEKGSLAVDGVSLTVADVRDRPDGSPVVPRSLVPTTLAANTLGSAAVGTTVNLEVDVVAKYVERLTSFAQDRT